MRATREGPSLLGEHRCPEISGRLHGDDFEINEVVPLARPASQQFRIRCFHDLETARSARFHPTRVVGDALGEHPAATFEAVTDQRDAARFEMFDDHEEHAPQSTPAGKPGELSIFD